MNICFASLGIDIPDRCYLQNKTSTVKKQASLTSPNQLQQIARHLHTICGEMRDVNDCSSTEPNKYVMSGRTYRYVNYYIEILYWYRQARLSIRREDGHSSLPQAFDELVHAIKAKALVGSIADVHWDVLRVELVPEVPAARQACQTDNPVVRLAQPGDFPPT